MVKNIASKKLSYIIRHLVFIAKIDSKDPIENCSLYI